MEQTRTHHIIGDATVSRLYEMPGPRFRLTTLYPDFTPDILPQHEDWLPGYCDMQKLAVVMSLHSWIIRIDGAIVLVDTCVGNHKDRLPATAWHQQETPYLARLQDMGLRPEDIDYVLCTHLHPDHVGWNTRLADGRWVPTFPNAKYVFSRDEYSALKTHAEAAGTAADDMDRLSFEDSVAPLLAHGCVLMVEGAHRLHDALHIDPRPGHTPGHISLTLESAGQAAVFVGDILHHPLQIFYPEWNSRFCQLPDLARRSRRAVLEECAEKQALLMPAHFAAPHTCTVHRAGAAYRPEWVHGTEAPS